MSLLEETMAEARVTDEPSSADSSSCDLNSSVLECAVCLQTCVHPAQLPCGHIFCFLCIKGVANQSKRCAMCRQEIPSDYFDKPHLVEQSASVKESAVSDDGYQWFYEGRNGWWQYDERTSRELENAYKKGERTCELLIAGFLYVADFDAMLQLRRSELTRRRRIKRDLATIPKKGVAGLRLEGSQHDEPPRAKSPSSISTTSSAGDGSTTPIPPTNTPQTPAGGNTSGDTTPDRRESIHQAMEQIRSLCLRDLSVCESSSDEGEAEASEVPSAPDEDVASKWVHTLSFDEDQL